MAKFYGMSDAEISSMSVSRFNDYANAMVHLEAEELLILSKISILPDLKKGPREKWFKQLQSKLRKEEGPEMTLQDLAAKIALGAQANGRKR